MPPFFLVIVVIALGSLALWDGEIFLLKGSAGLNWLNGFNWSAIPICLLIALACAVAIHAPTSAARTRKTVFVISSFGLFLAAFVVMRQVSISFTARQFFVPGEVHWSASSTPLLDLAIMLLCWSGTASGVVWFANKFVAKLTWWTILVVAAAIAFVPLLALFTVQVLPSPNGHPDIFQALKMGYPVFWTALLIPLALRWGARAGSRHGSLSI